MGLAEVQRLRKTGGGGSKYALPAPRKVEWSPTLAGEPELDRSTNSRAYVSEAFGEQSLHAVKQQALRALAQPNLSGAERERLSFMAMNGYDQPEPKWMKVLEKLDALGGFVRLGVADVFQADQKFGKEIGGADYRAILRGDQETLKFNLGEEIVGEDGRVSGTQLLKLAGWEDREEQTKAEQFGRGVAGFGLDVLLDPISYLTFGTAGLGKRAASEIGEAAVKASVGRITAQAGEGALDDALRRGVADGLDGVSERILREASEGYAEKFAKQVDDEARRIAGKKADEEAIGLAKAEIMSDPNARQQFADRVLQETANKYQDNVVQRIAQGRWGDLARENPEWIADKSVSAIAKGGVKLTTPFGRKAVDGGIDLGIPRWNGFRNAAGDRLGKRIQANPIVGPMAEALGKVKGGFGGNAALQQKLRRMGKSSALGRMLDDIAEWNIKHKIPLLKNEASALMTDLSRRATSAGIDPKDFEQTLGRMLGATAAGRQVILDTMEGGARQVYDDAHREVRDLFNRMGRAYAEVDEDFVMREDYFPLVATDEWSNLVDKMMDADLRLAAPPDMTEVPEELRNGVTLVMELIGRAEKVSRGRKVAIGSFGRANERAFGDTLAFPFPDIHMAMVDPETIAEVLGSAADGTILSTTWLNNEMRKGLNYIRRQNGLGSLDDDFNFFSTNVVEAMDSYVTAMANASEMRIMLKSAESSGLAFKASEEMGGWVVDSQRVLNALHNKKNGLSPARMRQLQEMYDNLGERADLILSRGGPKVEVKVGKGVTIQLEESVAKHPTVVAALDEVRKLTDLQGARLRDYVAARRTEVRELVKLGVPEEMANEIVFSADVARVDDAIAVIREAAGEEARSIIDMVDVAAARFDWSKEAQIGAKDAAHEAATRLKADARNEANKLKKLKGERKRAAIKRSVEQGEVNVPRTRKAKKAKKVERAAKGAVHNIEASAVDNLVRQVVADVNKRWVKVTTEGGLTRQLVGWHAATHGVLGKAQALRAMENLKEVELELYGRWRKLFDDAGVRLPDQAEFEELMQPTNTIETGKDWYQDLLAAIVEKEGITRNGAGKRVTSMLSKMREEWGAAAINNGIELPEGMDKATLRKMEKAVVKAGKEGSTPAAARLLNDALASQQKVGAKRIEETLIRQGLRDQETIDYARALFTQMDNPNIQNLDLVDGQWVLRTGADAEPEIVEVVEDVIENEVVKYSIIRTEVVDGVTEGVQLGSVTNKIRKLTGADSPREAWERVDEVLDQLSERELITVEHFNRSQTLDRYLNLTESLSEAAVRGGKGVPFKSRVESATRLRTSVQRLLDRPSRKRSEELLDVWEKERRIIASTMDKKQYAQVKAGIERLAWSHNYDTPKAWRQRVLANEQWWEESVESTLQFSSAWDDLDNSVTAALQEEVASIEQARAMFQSLQQSLYNLGVRHGSHYDPATGEIVINDGAEVAATKAFRDDLKKLKEEAAKAGRSLENVSWEYMDKELKAEARKLVNGLKKASKQDWLKEGRTPLGIDPKGYMSLRSMNGVGELAEELRVHPVIGKMVANATARMQTALTPAGLREISTYGNQWFRWWKASVTVGRVFDFNLNNAIGASFNAMIAGVGVKEYKALGLGMQRYRHALRQGIAPHEALRKAFPDKELHDRVLRGIYHNVVGDSFSDADLRYISDSSGSLVDIEKWWKSANPADIDNFILFKGGARLMESVEDFFRMATWLRWYDGEGSERFAKSIVDATQFNYDDLSHMEESIKKVVPFFVWTARNLPLQVRTLIERPAIAGRYVKAMSNIDETFGQDEVNAKLGFPSYVNGYAADLNIRLGNEEDGYTFSFLFDPRVPLTDVAQVFDINMNPETWISFIDSNLGPQYTALPELALRGEWGGSTNAPRGVNELLLGLSAVGLYDNVSAQGDAQISHVIDHGLNTFAPLLGNSLEMVLPTDPRAQQRQGYTSSPENALNIGSPQEIVGGTILRNLRGLGLKVNSPVDVPSKAYDSREEIDAILDKLKLQGQYVGP